VIKLVKILKEDDMRNKILMVVCVLALVGSLLASFSCAAKTTTTNTTTTTKATIKIGVIVGQTGDLATLGIGILKGFNLAMEQAGYQVAGHPIQVIEKDEGNNDPNFTMDVARQLVEGSQVDIMVGPMATPLQIPVLPYISQHNIPDILPIYASDQELNIPNIFSCGGTVVDSAIPLGWYAYDELGLRTAVAIQGDMEALKQFEYGFIKGFSVDRQGTITLTQTVPLNTSDFSSYITSMGTPGCVGFCVLPSVSQTYITQMNQYGVLSKVPIMVLGQQVDPSQVPAIGPIAAGHVYQIDNWVSDYNAKVNQDFVAAFKAKYGEAPNTFAACGYCRAMFILKVLGDTNGNTNVDKFREAALKIQSFDTPMGPVSFGPHNPDNSGIVGVMSYFISEIKNVNGNYQLSLVKQGTITPFSTKSELPANWGQ
jgi:branched-chain amino acid transport system substrate-binding protein